MEYSPSGSTLSSVTFSPASQVIAFSSALDWSTLGAVPEMLQTAYGSLTVGLDTQPGQSILIRGGTSSVGMVIVQIPGIGKSRPPPPNFSLSSRSRALRTASNFCV